MFKKFVILFCFIMVYPKLSVAESHWIFDYRSPLDESTNEYVTEENTKVDFSEQLHSNSSNNGTESNILFLTSPDMNSTDLLQMESETLNTTHDTINSQKTTFKFFRCCLKFNESTLTDQQPSKPTKIDQINKESETHEALFDASNVSESKLDEKIVLSRNNCNLEIFVQEGQDLKIEIEFQKLENNTSGKCCVTLNGEMNSSLGVVISNLHLYQKYSQGEVLKVIIADYGPEYVLKEYYSWSKYQQLILTETHRVYLVLYYEVKSVPLNEKNSHFNLEVFSYHKYENFIANANNYTFS